MAAGINEQGAARKLFSRSAPHKRHVVACAASDSVSAGVSRVVIVVFGMGAARDG